MSAVPRPYRHLNRDGRWPGFTWTGLELDAAGVLRLMALPRLMGDVPDAVAALASVQPVAGVAAAPDGTVYFTDPARHAVHRVDGCSGAVGRVPCLGGHGRAPTQFSEPAGLAIHPERRALYVADAGNGRIQIFDLATLSLAEIITGFVRPVSLAVDDAGDVYVVDTGRRRVDRLTIAGDTVPSFWTRVHASGRITDPLAVACDGDVVFVLDGATREISLFEKDGTWIGSTGIAIPQASVFTACAGGLCVASPGQRRIAVLRRDQHGAYVRAGDVAGYDGPAAALACAPDGSLLLAPGGGLAPLRIGASGSYGHDGWLVSGAIRVGDIPRYWNRLHADAVLAADSHLQFFFHTGPMSAPPAPPSPDGVPAEWRAAGSDATDLFLTFDGAKAEALWLAARLSNDLHATPALAQLRVDFDQESYLPYLPAIFRDGDCGELLLRYVSLVESFFRELEDDIEALPTLVDPAAADAATLAWLAGFLALPLPETWREREQREAIAGAYARYARRGTVAGLREALWIEAGVRATIDEPIQAAGWWAMPAGDGLQDRGLGLDTVLADAEPQGAVVGSTATLDRSHLIDDEAFGTPLFEGVAYRFTVLVYPGDVSCPAALDRITAIVEREKPAHTIAAVCVVEPGIRIGYRARLGVDTLLGDGRLQGRLGGGQLVLGGVPPGRLGKGTRVGVGTQL